MTATLTGDVLEDQPARPGTGRRWLRPLGSYALTIFVLLNLNFFLPRTLPGDPIEILAAQASPGQGGEEARARWRPTTGWTSRCSSSTSTT